jgi:hypothetical protein
MLNKSVFLGDEPSVHEGNMVKLVCAKCQLMISVSEGTISVGDTLELQCPICHGSLELEQRDQSDAAQIIGSSLPTSSSGSKSEFIHQSDEITPLHLTEVGGGVALVCIADQVLSERVARLISKLDFHVIVAQRASSALSNLENHHCDLIILDEKYGLGESSENLVLIYMQRLPMSVRRRSFLCILSEEAPTLDQMAAFRNGANLILNSQDVEKIPIIFDRILKDHQAFYAVLYDELAKRGVSSV